MDHARRWDTIPVGRFRLRATLGNGRDASAEARRAVSIKGPGLSADVTLDADTGALVPGLEKTLELTVDQASRPQQCLNFLPEPQVQVALRPVGSLDGLVARPGKLSLSVFSGGDSL